MFEDVDEYFLSWMSIKQFEHDSFVGLNDESSFLIQKLFDRSFFNFFMILFAGHRLLDNSIALFPLHFCHLFLVFLEQVRIILQHFQ